MQSRVWHAIDWPEPDEAGHYLTVCGLETGSVTQVAEKATCKRCQRIMAQREEKELKRWWKRLGEDDDYAASLKRTAPTRTRGK